MADMGFLGRRKSSAQSRSDTEKGWSSTSIVPLVAGPDWVEETKRILAGGGVPMDAWPIQVPVGGGLVATYALDEPHGFEYLQQGQLPGLGMDLNALHQTALETLIERAQSSLTATGDQGRYCLEMPGNEDLVASLVLVPHLWSGQLHVAGQPVAAIATRIRLHLCGSDDTDSVRSLGDLASQLYRQAEGKPVTPSLITWRDGRLESVDSSSD
jgi:hypothetical protein